MPTIQSPTPVTGVKSRNGKPGTRLPVQTLQKDHPFAFALYIQALSRWQKAGFEEWDKDANNGTSYFQVVGVHGVPFTKWQDDPTQPVEKSVAGYCTHRSVLFVPWHRPYLMLYEQIIYAYAEEIADEAESEYAKQAYRDALEYVRLPFWDWASDPHLPDVTMRTHIDLQIPGNGNSETVVLSNFENPLYSYKFTSEYANSVVQEELGWSQYPPLKAWEESKRCPDEHGVSQQDIANSQMGTYTYFKESVYYSITSVHNFDEFTCMAWRPKLNMDSYDSLEHWHGAVHNHTGTCDSKLASGPSGNMTDVQGSSFDPIFWLHHCQVDRLAALWQALNPTNTHIDTYPLLDARFTAALGTEEGAESNLEPWHKTDAHNMQDYYIANDISKLSSTLLNGYVYPETPIDLFSDEQAMQQHVLTQINEEYKPTTGVSKKWQVFARVNNFALPGTWGIHVFFGTPPAHAKDYFESPNRVGTMTFLSNPTLDNCPNCKNQEAAGLLVTGAIILNEALITREKDLTDVSGIVEYLKEDLAWRVAKDTQDETITPEFKMIFGLSSRDITFPTDDSQFPSWGESVAYPEATAGKPGGLTEDNRAQLNV